MRPIYQHKRLFPNTQLRAICNFVRSELYADRTGNFNLTDIYYDPLPNPNTKMTIEDCVMESAQNIWAKHKSVTCMWSGGIDSSAVLIGLLEQKPKDAELKVYYTPSSIKEFPVMYEKLVKDKWDMPDIIEYDTLVTGECGDQLFGSETMHRLHHDMTKPWEHMFTYDAKTFFGNDTFEEIFWEEQKPILMDVADTLADSYPGNMITLKDFLWWANFTQKWNAVQVRAMYYYKVLELNHPSKVVSFFNTPSFQQWSMSNQDKTMSGDWKTYKQPLKDFIHKYCPDETYHKEKLKVPSIINIIKHDWNVIDKNTIVEAFDDGTVRYYDSIC
jgi:hypothetical protein